MADFTRLKKLLIDKITNGEAVRYNGYDYLPFAYRAEYKDGSWHHQMELRDPKALHSVVVAPLGKLEDEK